MWTEVVMALIGLPGGTEGSRILKLGIHGHR